MKRLILKLFIVLLPFGILVSVTNYLIDPANLFSEVSYVNGIAEILLKGHNVENIQNYDERLCQKVIALGMKSAPDIIVLGSSKVMEVNSEFVPGAHLKNFAVSRASINDLIAIVGLLDSLNKMPRRMIIEVDAAIVTLGLMEWNSLVSFHRYAMKNILKEPFEYEVQSSDDWRKMRALFSLNYFHDCIAFKLKGTNKQYVDVGDSVPQVSGRFSDGSISYPYSYTHPDIVKMAMDAKYDGEKYGMPEIDGYYLQLMKDLFSGLKKKGTAVELVLIPYHPEYVSAVNKKSNDLLIRAEKTFRQMAADLELPIFGSLDPLSKGLTRNDYYDRWHCNKTSLMKVLSGTNDLK